MAKRLRFRLFAMILPLVIVVVVLSGVFSSLQSRASLTQIANRHLAYKAEQLRDYFYSEWQVITRLGLNDQIEYRKASEQSFSSFAFSLLRSRTEVIYAFDAGNRVAKRISLQEPPVGSSSGTERLPEPIEAGWFSGVIFGEPRVGVAFYIEPFGWMVIVTELDDTFFADIRTIGVSHAAILIASVLAVIFFLSLFVGHIVGPIERLTKTITDIAATGNLDERASLEYDDEIGLLSRNFNGMVESLQESYVQLEQTHQAETQARRMAVEREEEALRLLGRISDARDEETGSHLKRIGVLSAELARLLGQSEERQQLLLYSAPLHDIGKIGIPESIIFKTGKLSPEEYEIMKKHTVYGYELLKDTKSIYLSEGARIALTHHEKWDGSGYPSGLRGEDIPLVGRIVGLVDVFDALTSTRPYKKAWSPEEALDYIVDQRGRHFDPELVDLFKRNFEFFRQSAEARG